MPSVIQSPTFTSEPNDTKVSWAIEDIDDIQKPQNGLNIINKWANQNNKQFNNEKF